jgi:hypothetical protein
MIIGQHFLEGSVVELKAPYLLLDEPEDCEIAEEVESHFDKQLSIRGVVKKKIIFKTRPKPVGLKRPRDDW